MDGKPDYGKEGLFKTSLDEKHRQSFFAREGVNPLTHAFEKKVAVHAGFGGRPLPIEHRDQTVNHLLSRGRTGKSAVYIHVPFCETHCLYCGFYNRNYKKSESPRFTDALLREIDLWRDQPAVNQGPVHAVYIGGGTPTALEKDDLYRLLKHVKAAFPLANDCEITVEGRIHNFGVDKMEACLAGGANRFSLGVQTFHTDLRRSMKRLADRRKIFDALNTLSSFGSAVVIIDLIFGFPGQTMDMWRRDIEDFISLNIDGADLYQLNIFPKSPLAEAISRKEFPEAADLPAQGLLFGEGVRMLTKERYRRLSVSHWGKTSRERNIYNHMMKDVSECLAYGPGAGGSLKDHLFFVETDYEKWISSVNNNEKPLSFLLAPDPFAELNKTISAGFDLGRINKGEIESKCGILSKGLLNPLLDQWQRAGLIEIDDDWVELNVAGQFWHVNLAQFMIEFLRLNLSKEPPTAEDSKRKEKT